MVFSTRILTKMSLLIKKDEQKYQDEHQVSTNGNKLNSYH